MIKITKKTCYHNHIENVTNGIWCKDCNTQIMTYAFGKPRFN